MTLQNQFNQSLKTLQENKYEIYLTLVNFLKNNKDFDHKKFERIKQLPQNYWALESTQTALELNLKVVCWMGLITGLQATHTIEKYQNNKSHIIIEPSLEVFSCFLMLPSAEKIIQRKNIFWIIGQPLEKLPIYYEKISKSQTIIDLSLKNSNIIRTPGYQDSYFEKAISLWNSFMAVSTAGTCISPLDEYYGFQNSIINSKKLLNAPLIQCFKNKFRGTPGIVVSTGPSLNKTIKLLKNVGNNAIIYCADSGYKILKNEGIQPHFVGCLERVGLTTNFFSGSKVENSYLIATSVAHENTLNLFDNRIIHFNRPQFGYKYFFPNIPSPLSTIPSVAHLGLYSLWLMGCSPIYLLGQDLAFDPDTQQSHALGHYYSKEEQPWTEITAENNEGQLVKTDYLWVQFVYALSELIRRYNINCYNVMPQRYGIKINNAQRIEPAQDTFLFPDRDEDIFSALARITAESATSIAHVKEVFTHQLSTAKLEISKCLSIATNLLASIVRFSNNFDNSLSISSENYIKFRNQIETDLQTISSAQLLKPLLLGKNIDIAKHMRLVPVSNTDKDSQWNYLSFLSHLLGQEISICHLVLNLFQSHQAKLS